MTSVRFSALAAFVLAWVGGCADNAESQNNTVMYPVSSGEDGALAPAGDGDDSSAGDTNDGDDGDSDEGAFGGGAQGDGADGAADDSAGDDGTGDDGSGAGCADDPNTNGNDCPGVVSCGKTVDACSLASQACCVDDYKADAVSCSDEAKCDGLTAAACDGKEDCNGGFCCISVKLAPNPFNPDVKHRCVESPDKCTGGDITNAFLCHTDKDCPLGNSCGKTIGAFPWWNICN